MAEYTTPPPVPVQDAMAQARAAGHSWPEVQNAVVQPQIAAAKAGFTQDQIDEHLHTPSAQPVHDQLHIHVAQTTAEPGEAPILSVPNNDVPGISAAPEKPVEVSPAVRQIYANGLVAGQVQGPSDFAKAYTDAHLSAGATAPHTEAELTANLPTNADLTDYSLQVLGDNRIPTTPGAIRTAKQNLGDAWAQSGIPIDQLYSHAQNNPTFSDALTRPKPLPDPVERASAIPADVTTRDMFLNHIAKGESSGDYNRLYGKGGEMQNLPKDETGFPIWSGQDNSHAAGKYQFEPATWHAEYKKLGLTGGMTPANQDAAAWDLAKTDYQRNSGGNLEADLTAGNKGQQIADALHTTWTSLGHETRGGILGFLSRGAEYIKNEFMGPEAAVGPFNVRQGVSAVGVAGSQLGHLAERILLPTWMQTDAIKNDDISSLGGLMDFLTHGDFSQLKPTVSTASEVAQGMRDGTLAKGAAGEGLEGAMRTRPGEVGAIGNLPPGEEIKLTGGEEAVASMKAPLTEEEKAKATARAEAAKAHTETSAQQDRAKAVASLQAEKAKTLEPTEEGKPVGPDATAHADNLDSKIERITKDAGADDATLVAERDHILQASDKVGSADRVNEIDEELKRRTPAVKDEPPETALTAKPPENTATLPEATAIANQQARGWTVMLDPFKNVFSSGITRAQREARGAMKGQLIKMNGQVRLAKAQATVLLNKNQKLIDKFMPEFDKALNDGSLKADLRQARDNRMDLADHISKGGKEEDFIPKRQVQLPAIQQFYDHMQGVPGSKLPITHPLYQVAEGAKQIFDDTRERLAQSGHDVSGWKETYFPQGWTDANKAGQAIEAGNGGKRGYAGHLQKKDIPTINDGIAAGLKPKFPPLDTIMHYVSGIHSWVNHQDLLKWGEDQGRITWATHNPGEGWVQMREVTRRRGPITQYGYAQPGAAEVYNNWAGKGFHDWSPRVGNLFDRLSTVKNSMTAINLAFPGFHYYATGVEAAIGDVALGQREISRGQVVSGLAHFLLGETSAVVHATTFGVVPNPSSVVGMFIGRRLTRQGLKIADYGPKTEYMANLYAKSGGDFLGRGSEFGGNMANLFEKLRRGIWASSLKKEFKNIYNHVDEGLGYKAAMAVPRATGIVLGQVMDAMNTLSAPLFDKMIPWIKRSQWSQDVSSWIKAHPTASEEAIEAYGIRAHKTLENRLGEMVDDNLFINKMAKRTLDLAVVSKGWELGTLRGVYEGGKELGTGRVFGPNASWLTSLAIVVGTISATTEYMATGKGPQDTDTPWLDMIYPRNGKLNADNTPSRDAHPSQMKDIIQLYKIFTAGNPSKMMSAAAESVSNRFNPFMRAGEAVASAAHSTWMGTPITSSYRGAGGHSVPTGIFPNTNYTAATPKAVPEWWTSWLDWMADNVAPIISGMEEKKGENWWQTAMGTKNAPSFLGDQPAYEKSQAAKEKREEAEGLAYARYQNKQLENPDPSIPMPGDQSPARSTGGLRGNTKDRL